MGRSCIGSSVAGSAEIASVVDVESSFDLLPRCGLGSVEAGGSTPQTGVFRLQRLRLGYTSLAGTSDVSCCWLQNLDGVIPEAFSER